LAYPECSYAMCDKIACAQFIIALSDRFIKRMLQLEGVTSLDLAIRAKAIKGIQEENFGRKGENFCFGKHFERERNKVLG